MTQGSAEPAPDLQPVLTCDYLVLRPLRQDDFDALYAVASDPLIWEQHPSTDRYKPEVFAEFFREALATRTALVVIDRASGSVVGSSRYFGYDPVKREIEIGWSFLARSHWGGAYNREMKHLMLAHAFTFVRTVVFLVGPANTRSLRAMEKLGGVRIGMRPNANGLESVVFQIAAHGGAAVST